MVSSMSTVYDYALQKLLLAETQLTFSGNDGVECEKFIHAIRRTAYIAGKLRDNDWIMDLVYSALTGEALRWVEGDAQSF